MRRFRKIIKLFIYSIVSILVLLAIVLQFASIQKVLAKKVIDTILLENGIDAVNFERLKIGMSGKVLLYNLQVSSSDTDNIITIEKLKARVGIIALLQKRIVVKRLLIKGSSGEIIRTKSGQYNFQPLLPEFSESKSPSQNESTFALDIDVKEIALYETSLRFHDSVSQTFLDAKVGKFETNLEGSNIALLRFNLDKIELENSEVILGLDNSITPQPTEQEGQDSLLPIITPEHLHFKNVRIRLNQYNKNSYLEAFIHEIKGKEALVDIGNEIVEVKSLKLENSSYVMDYSMDTSMSIAHSPVTEISSDRINYSGGWTIQVGNFKSKNNSAALLLKAESDTLNVFNPSWMRFQNTNFELNQTEVRREGIVSSIRDISFNTPSGFELLDGNITLDLNENLGRIIINNLETRNSRISATVDAHVPVANLDYRNMQLREFSLIGTADKQDLTYFVPQLSKQLDSTKLDKISLNIAINGEKDNFQVHKAQFASGENLLELHGYVQSFTNPEEMQVYAQLDTFLVNPEEVFASKSLTEKLKIFEGWQPKFQISGKLDSLLTSISFMKEDAVIKVKTISFIESSLKSIEGDLFLENIRFSDFIKDTLPGELGAQFGIKSKWEGPDSLKSLSIIGEIHDLKIAELVLDKIYMDANYVPNAFNLQTKHLSNALDLDFHINGIISHDSIHFWHTLDVRDFDLQSLRLVNQKVLLQSNMKGQFLQKKDHLAIHSNFDTLNVEFKDESIELPGTVELNRLKSFYQTRISFPGILLKVHGNLPAEKIKQEVIEFIAQTLNPEADYLPDAKEQFVLEIEAFKPERIQSLLSKLWLDTLTVETVDLRLDLQNKELRLQTELPHFRKTGLQLDNLKAQIELDNNNFKAELSLDKLGYKNIETNKLEFYAHDFKQGISSKFALLDKQDNILAMIPVNISQKDSILRIGVESDSLILGYQQWQTNDEILIQFDSKSKEWHTNSVRVFSENQSIEFTDETNEMQISFNGLELAKTSRYLTFSDTAYLTGGIISGKINVLNTVNSALLKSHFTINDLSVLNTPYGNFDIQFNEESVDKYYALVHGKNNYDQLSYNGNFGNRSNNKHALKLSIVDISKYTPLIDTNKLELKEGRIDADINADFSKKKSHIEGFLKLKDAVVKITPIGSAFRFRDETIDLSTQGIHFQEVLVEDLAGNKLLFDGNIFTQDYTNFRYDLIVSSDYFQVFNSTAEQNPLLFGKLFISANAAIQGANSSPTVNAKLKVHKNTDFTVVFPDEDPLQNNADDVVRFTERHDTGTDSLFISDNIQNVSGAIDSALRGGSFDILLTFSPGARYTIVTNPISGDFTRFGLSGGLMYTSANSGITELTGNIQIVDGVYEMSFYEMVKKTFTIEPQSVIYFSGPLNNAALDVRAKHVVRTNSLALMSSEAIGNSPEEKALYNQRLPYELFFNLEGLLLSPIVSFSLDLPDEYKRNSPMIASKLNKLSSPDMEQERNMQVFALLVTGGFIAENTNVASGSGASDVAATTARNSINSILSQQLNNITSENIEFVDMNLGLNTYEDYARRGGRTTTDLDVQISKKLFDDRISFEMESRINLDGSANPSQSKSNYNTDYRLYYTIDEDGRYLVKAYNLSIYDLFDGDITNAGVGIMFSKDFEGKKRKNYVEADSISVHD
jgi:translocation and assembly module TamB